MFDRQVYLSAMGATLLASASLAQMNTSGTAPGSVGAGTPTPDVSTSIVSGTSTSTTIPSSVANPIGWDSENQYWRNQYPSRTYYHADRSYTVYEPAYRYGVESYRQNAGRNYSDLDQERLRKGWEQARGQSSLSWDDAQYATRDAYNRIYENRTDVGASTRTR